MYCLGGNFGTAPDSAVGGVVIAVVRVTELVVVAVEADDVTDDSVTSAWDAAADAPKLSAFDAAFVCVLPPLPVSDVAVTY